MCHCLDERVVYLRHTIANVIALALVLPEKSSHVWYHIFAPEKLQGTYITGYMVITILIFSSDFFPKATKI